MKKAKKIILTTVLIVVVGVVALVIIGLFTEEGKKATISENSATNTTSSEVTQITNKIKASEKVIEAKYGSWNNFVKQILKKIKPELCDYSKKVQKEYFWIKGNLNLKLDDSEKLFVDGFLVNIDKKNHKLFVDPGRSDGIKDDSQTWWYDGANIDKRTPNKTALNQSVIIEIDCSK